MTDKLAGPVPMTCDSQGNAVGARVPPSFWAKLCYPPCAISGYEHGDPTKGMCEGPGLIAFVLEILCCLGCIYSLCIWQPDPQNIKGDGTQRTVENGCMAGFCLGFPAIAFWENGDLCCVDGQCTWCSEGALIGCALHFIPSLISLPPLDCCYVMCCWTPEIRNFKRSSTNHGGGQPIVGAPMQAPGQNIELWKVQSMAAQQQPVVVGAAVQAQSVGYGAPLVAQPVQAQPVGYGAPPGTDGKPAGYGSPEGAYSNAQ